MPRPSKYKPEYCEKLIEFMAVGFSFEAFAGEVKVAKQTIYTWLEMHEEFRNAKQIADSRNRRFWEGAGLEGMWNKNFNPVVWIFNMKNRFQWQDRHEIQHELGENAQKLMISVQEAKQLVSADPIDVNVIDVSTEE
jgi:transposase